MNRGSLLWFGSATLLLLFAAWWFTVTTATARFIAELVPLVAPAILVIASTILFWVGWRKEISGLLVLATPLFGIGLIGFAQWFAGEALPWKVSWLLLPAFGGVGILIENHLGFGWRFTDRHGIALIFASLVVYLVALLWIIHSSGAGPVIRESANITIPMKTAHFPNVTIPNLIFPWR